MEFSGEVLQALRLVKLLGTMALAAGAVGAFLPASLADRQRAAYFVAGPAWGVTMVLGFLLTFARGQTLLSTWVLASLVLSIFSINVILFAVGKEGRRTPLSAALGLGSLVTVVVLMVYQPA